MPPNNYDMMERTSLFRGYVFPTPFIIKAFQEEEQDFSFTTADSQSMTLTEQLQPASRPSASLSPSLQPFASNPELLLLWFQASGMHLRLKWNGLMAQWCATYTASVLPGKIFKMRHQSPADSNTCFQNTFCISPLKEAAFPHTQCCLKFREQFFLFIFQ